MLNVIVTLARSFGFVAVVEPSPHAAPCPFCMRVIRRGDAIVLHPKRKLLDEDKRMRVGTEMPERPFRTDREGRFMLIACGQLGCPSRGEPVGTFVCAAESAEEDGVEGCALITLGEVRF